MAAKRQPSIREVAERLEMEPGHRRRKMTPEARKFVQDSARPEVRKMPGMRVFPSPEAEERQFEREMGMTVQEALKMSRARARRMSSKEI